MLRRQLRERGYAHIQHGPLGGTDGQQPIWIAPLTPVSARTQDQVFGAHLGFLLSGQPKLKPDDAQIVVKPHDTELETAGELR